MASTQVFPQFFYFASHKKEIRSHWVCPCKTITEGFGTMGEHDDYPSDPAKDFHYIF
jgi:hypothetical protein